MANPMYGQNKADNMLDALADADATLVAAGENSGSAGAADGCNADNVITVVIEGTTYYIPLFTSNS